VLPSRHVEGTSAFEMRSQIWEHLVAGRIHSRKRPISASIDLNRRILIPIATGQFANQYFRGGE
jgi:hypothetical protein